MKSRLNSLTRKLPVEQHNFATLPLPRVWQRFNLKHTILNMTRLNWYYISDLNKQPLTNYQISFPQKPRGKGRHPNQTNGPSAPGHPPSLLDPLLHQTSISQSEPLCLIFTENPKSQKKFLLIVNYIVRTLKLIPKTRLWVYCTFPSNWSLRFQYLYSKMALRIELEMRNIIIIFNK